MAHCVPEIMHIETSRTQKERQNNSLHNVKYLMHLSGESLALLQMSFSAELDPLAGIIFQIMEPRHVRLSQSADQYSDTNAKMLQVTVYTPELPDLLRKMLFKLTCLPTK